MVSSGELAVIGTLAGAIVTGAINMLSTKSRQKSENERQKGVVFLEKKADALISLNKSLTNCDGVIDKFKIDKEGSPLADIYSVDEQEVKDALHETSSLFDRATIFLNEEEEQIIEDAILAMILKYYSISDEYQMDFDDARLDPKNRSEYVSKARKVLASKIDSPTNFS